MQGFVSLGNCVCLFYFFFDLRLSLPKSINFDLRNPCELFLDFITEGGVHDLDVVYDVLPF